MSNRTRITTGLALGAAALAITLAPAAQAAPNGPTCTSAGATSTLCQTDGNAQFTATPPAVDYQAQYPFFGGYGLLFHHGGDRG